MNSFDSDLSLETKKPPVLVAVSRFYSRLFLNRYFFLFLFCLACIIVVTEKEVLGAAIFIGIICLSLILCEDILASTLPFLLLCVFLTSCYDSYDLFIPYAWVAFPALGSILFHFIVYRRKIQIGNTFLGLISVAVAVTLGGVGALSAQDYFRPVTLYYTVFLGVGMVIAYLLIKSQMSVPRGYDVREKLLTMLYLMGIFACFMVLFFLTNHIRDIRMNLVIPPWQPSNNISTVLMIALPCPLFFVPRNRLHFLSFLGMMSCLLLTGSRSGLLLGSIEFLICLLIAAAWDKPRRFPYICIGIAAVGSSYLFGNSILQFCTNINWQDFISSDEARSQLLERAWGLFRQYPIFGHGLGYTGNTDLYKPVSGALTWYHMMIPQVVAGMGIVGIAAYGFQAFLQARCTWIACRSHTLQPVGPTLTLVCCYGGLLLMSQLNPGLFCPLPYTLIATLIFAAIDGNEGPWPLRKSKRHKKHRSVSETSDS